MKKSFYTLFSILLCCATTIEAQWKHSGGPYNGGVSLLSRSHQYLFAASGKGLFRTEDPALGWQRVGPECGYIHHLFTSNNRIAAVVATQNSGRSILISDDEGDTWNTISPPPSTIGQSVRIWLGNTKMIYSIDNTHLQSTDGGITWDTMPLPLVSLTFHGEKIYYGQTQKYFVSEDEGATWQLYNVPGLNTIRVLEVNGDKVLVRSSDGKFRCSYDGGITWGNIFDLDNEAPKAIWVENTIIAIKNTYSINYSVDNGMTWQTADLRYFSHTLYESALIYYKDRIFMGTFDVGCVQYEVPNTLITQNKGLAGGGAKQLVQNQGKIWALNTFGYDAFSGTINSQDVDWGPMPDTVTIPPGSRPAFITAVDDALFVFDENDLPRRSFDNGISWDTFSLPAAGNPFGSWEDFEPLVHQNHLFYTNGVTPPLRSDNAGDDFVLLNNLQPQPYMRYQLASSGNLLYAALQNQVSDTFYIRRSADNGDTWENTGFCYTPPPPDTLPNLANAKLEVFALFAAGDRLLIHIGRNYGIESASQLLVSSDGGQSWVSAMNGIVEGEYHYARTNITFQEVNPQTLLLTWWQVGNFRSADGGLHWTDNSEGLCAESEVYNYFSAYTVHDGIVYAAINGDAVYTRPVEDLLSSVSDDQEKTPAPLVTVSPNPAAGSSMVTFQWQQPVQPNATITVFRASGQMALQAPIAAGSTHYNMSNSLPPGAYYAVVNDGSMWYRPVLVVLTP
jgi:photosystem II stability/assembly factor-like uncharacterized protein